MPHPSKLEFCYLIGELTLNAVQPEFRADTPFDQLQTDVAAKIALSKIDSTLCVTTYLHIHSAPSE